MPGFKLVQGFTEARLRKGLDAKEVAQVRDFVLDGRGEPSDLQREQLLRLSVLYADYFTPSAKSAWQKLTGIDVDEAESIWKKSAKLYANVLDARIDVAGEKKRIHGDHVINATGSTRSSQRVDVASRLLAEDVQARMGAPPAPSRLTHAEALALDLPPALLVNGVADGKGRVLPALVKELVAFEKRCGDGDGVLAPRDMAKAPAHLVALLEKVWAERGRKTLDIKSEIAPSLPKAYVDVALGGRRQENKLGGDTAEMFRLAVQDGFDLLARQMQSEAVRGDVPFTLVLERNGIRQPAHKGEIMRALEAITPPPTLKEIARLYARAVDEKIGAKDFYTVTRLTKDDVFQLQASFPELFPRDADQKHSTALPARRVLGATSTSTTLTDLADVARAWTAEVATGQKTVEQFTVDHGLRSNVLTRLRKENPQMFPDAPPRASKTDDTSLARHVADALDRAMQADPFAKVPALVEWMNKNEPALVKANGGALTYARYYDIRKKNPEQFGRADDSTKWHVPVAAKVREIMAREPALTRAQLVERLQQTWPSMTYSRLSHLKEADASVPIPGSFNRRAAGDIDGMAQQILEILRKAPDTSHRVIAKLLTKQRGEQVDAPYVSYIIRDARPALFSGVGDVDDKRIAPRRQGLVAHSLLQLAIRMAPPGAPVEKILEVLNKMLEERGVGTLSASYLPRLTELAEAKGLPGPSQVHARVTAQIVAEYAAAAPKGTTEEEIFAAVQRDWPSLDGRSFGRYRGMWRSAPKEYPELARFAKGGIRGLGAGDTTPHRFRGGHDPARQLAMAPAEEQAELARFAELAAIPLRLPEIDAVVADLKNSAPLKMANVLWVSHLLGDIVPMAHALKDGGAESSRTIVVGTPYGTNPSVKQCLEDIGFSVRKPKLDVEDYKRVVQKAIDDAIALHKKNGEPICVLDDGGLVSHLLHSDEKYKPYRKKFRIVEQTTGGVLLAEKHALESVVVNVARSKSKALEGEAIGEVVAAKIVQALNRFDRGLDEKELVLIGYGVVGPHIAGEMLARGAKVTVIERNKERAAAAKKAGFNVVLDDPDDAKSQAARRAALSKADLVVGATGRRTISLEDMKLLKDGAAVASASSKRIELDMDGLTKQAKSRTELPSNEPLVTLPTATYRLGGRKLHVIGDGFPVNFDGGVQSVPPEKIQLTDAAMLAALFQASRVGNTQRGLIDLDLETDERLLARHKAEITKGSAPVYDPTKWRDSVLAVAKLFTS